MRAVLVCWLLLWPPLAAADALLVPIGLLTQAREPVRPASPLDESPPDDGAAGARLGVADNATTGRFTGHRFQLLEKLLARGEAPEAALRELLDGGVRFVVADLEREALEALLRTRPKDLVILNSRAPDDDAPQRGMPRRTCCIRSRAAPCSPTRWRSISSAKRWRRWFLVVGRASGRPALCRRPPARGEALRRRDRRPRRSGPSGPARARPIRATSRCRARSRPSPRCADHDVLVVADEADEFGDYLARPHGAAAPGRRHARPRRRPAGARSHEQWGATQLQSRFEKLGRPAHDGASIMPPGPPCARVGEAATRTRSADPARDRRLSPRPRLRARRLQGPGPELPRLGRADAPADPDRRPADAGLGFAAAGLPAPRLASSTRSGIDREESRCQL